MVDAPAAFWKWFRDTTALKSDCFYAKNSMDAAEFPYYFFAFPPLKKDASESTLMDQFMQGVRTGVRKGAGADPPVAGLSHEPSDIPFPGVAPLSLRDPLSGRHRLRLRLCGVTRSSLCCAVCDALVRGTGGLHALRSVASSEAAERLG